MLQYYHLTETFNNTLIRAVEIDLSGRTSLKFNLLNSLISQPKHVVGTPDSTILRSTKNIGKKIFTILH